MEELYRLKLIQILIETRLVQTFFDTAIRNIYVLLMIRFKVIVQIVQNFKLVKVAVAKVLDKNYS
jgi:hypothetical protein